MGKSANDGSDEETLCVWGARGLSTNEDTGTGLIEIDNMALETARVACSGRIRRLDPMVGRSRWSENESEVARAVETSTKSMQTAR